MDLGYACYLPSSTFGMRVGDTHPTLEKCMVSVGHSLTPGGLHSDPSCASLGRCLSLPQLPRVNNGDNKCAHRTGCHGELMKKE